MGTLRVVEGRSEEWERKGFARQMADQRRAKVSGELCNTLMITRCFLRNINILLTFSWIGKKNNKKKHSSFLIDSKWKKKQNKTKHPKIKCISASKHLFHATPCIFPSFYNCRESGILPRLHRNAHTSFRSREQKQTLSHSLLHTQWSFTLRGAPGIFLGFVLWGWRASSCSSQAWSLLPPVFSLSP